MIESFSTNIGVASYGKIANSSPDVDGNGNGQKSVSESDGKLDQLYDFINELTKQLKGGNEEQNDDLTIPKTTGDQQGAYLNPNKQDELNTLADYMDQKNEENPGTYPNMNAGENEGDTWKNELSNKVDNFLNEEELSTLQQASKDMEADKAGDSDFNDLTIPGGTGNKDGAYLDMTKKDQLADVASFMDQKNAESPGSYPIDNAGGNEGDSWANELSGKVDNFLNEEEMNSLQQALRDMAAEKQGNVG